MRDNPGYQTFGDNHDWWPEKVVERHLRDVKHAPAPFTNEDLERIIAPMLDRQAKEREAREAAARAKAVA